MNRIKLVGNLGQIIQKIPRTLAENPFWTFLILLFGTFIATGIIFYSYGIVRVSSPGSLQPKTSFETPLFEQVNDEWNQRAQNFQQADQTSFPNIFLPVTDHEQTQQ